MTNPSKRQKEFLELDEYIALIETPIAIKEVRETRVFRLPTAKGAICSCIDA